MNDPTVSTLRAEEPYAPAWAEIDLSALRSNVRALRKRAGPAVFMAVVKADAYGHGAVPVTEALRTEGVRWFAVATVPEGIQLRQAGIQDRLLVFEAPLPEYLPAYTRHDLDLTVGSREIAEAVASRHARSGRLRVHLKVDTGMTRLGVDPAEVPRVMRLLESAPHLDVVSVWTHLATSDEQASPFVTEQYERFRRAVDPVKDGVEFVHAANSGGLLGWPDLFAAEGAGVRIGISLYGYPPSPHLAGEVALQPVMTFKARVLRSVTVPAGTTVSYNRSWKAPRETGIITLAAGYADGYPRILSNRASVGIKGRRLPVRGAVCMDMTMAEAASGKDAISPGDEAVLFGRGGPPATEVARWAQTITYELCTGVGKRVPRSYIE